MQTVIEMRSVTMPLKNMDRQGIERLLRQHGHDEPHLLPYVTRIIGAGVRKKPGIGTVAIDMGWRIYFDPDMGWSKTEWNAAVRHEIDHVYRRHFDRFMSCVDDRHEDRDRDEQERWLRESQVGRYLSQAWNITGDACINERLELGSELPKGAVLPHVIGQGDKWFEEMRFDRFLEDNPPPEEQEQEESGSEDPTDSREQGDGEEDSEGSGSDGSEGEQPMCGSAAGGPMREWEDPLDETAVSEQEQQAAHEQSFEAAIGQGMEHAGFRNVGAGDLEKATLRYWTQALHREAVRYISTKTRSYKKPARRKHNPPFMYPGKNRAKPCIAIVCDVSGSIGHEGIEQAWRVVDSFRGLPVDLEIIACGTDAVRISEDDWQEAGGGTHMPAAIDLIRTDTYMRSRDLRAIFFITDGLTGWDGETYDGDTGPDVPVVVFTWHQPGPKWAKTIEMPGLGWYRNV